MSPLMEPAKACVSSFVRSLADNAALVQRLGNDVALEGNVLCAARTCASSELHEIEQ